MGSNPIGGSKVLLKGGYIPFARGVTMLACHPFLHHQASLLVAPGTSTTWKHLRKRKFNLLNSGNPSPIGARCFQYSKCPRGPASELECMRFTNGRTALRGKELGILSPPPPTPRFLCDIGGNAVRFSAVGFSFVRREGSAKKSSFFLDSSDFVVGT